MNENQRILKVLIGISIGGAVIVAIFYGLRYYARRKHAAQLAKEKESGVDIESAWLETDLAKQTNLKQSVQLLAASVAHYSMLQERLEYVNTLIAEEEAIKAKLEAGKPEKVENLPESRAVAETETETLAPIVPNETEQAVAPALSVVRDAPKPVEAIEPIANTEAPVTYTSSSNDFDAYLSLSPSAPSGDNAPEAPENAVITPENTEKPVIPDENTAFESENERIAAMEKLEYEAIKNSKNIEDWIAFKDDIKVCMTYKAVAAKKIKALQRELDAANEQSESENKNGTE